MDAQFKKENRINLSHLETKIEEFQVKSKSNAKFLWKTQLKSLKSRKSQNKQKENIKYDVECMKENFNIYTKKFRDFTIPIIKKKEELIKENANYAIRSQIKCKEEKERKKLLSKFSRIKNEGLNEFSLNVQRQNERISLIDDKMQNVLRKIKKRKKFYGNLNE